MIKGRFVLTTVFGGILTLMSLTSFAQNAQLVLETGHTNSVNSVAFSPDGKTIASGSYDKTVRLWEVVSGKEMKTLSGHTELVSSVGFSPDGKTIASGSEDRTVKLWDAGSGNELRTLSGHTDAVSSVAFSPDGKTIASASHDKTVRLWDAASGNEIRIFLGQTDLATSVAFSPDGRTIASGSGDSRVKLWHADSEKALRTLFTRGPVHSVAFSPDGKTIASGGGGDDGTVELWDASSGKHLKTLSGHTGYVLSVVFSPDGKTIASGGRGGDGAVRLWNAASGKELKILSAGETGASSISFSPDGKTIAAGDDKTVRLWDAASGNELRTFLGHTNAWFSTAFSPDGKTIVSSGDDETVRLWDASSGSELRTLSGHTDTVWSVAFSPDGKTIVSASGDRTVRLWDAISGQELKTLSGHTSDVFSVVFSPDGKTIASGGGVEDGTVRLWDVASGKELEILLPGETGADSIAFSPDGKTIASGGHFGNTIKLWDASSGKELRTILVGEMRVGSIAFSPDGKTVASSGSFDNTIRLWDAASGKELRTLAGHTLSVDSIAFSPDGKTMASASRDKTIRLWDATSGKELQRFEKDGANTAREVFAVVPDLYWKGQTDSVTKDGSLQVKIGEKDQLNLHEVKTGKLLASLIALDEADWVVIDPDGRFDASPGAQKLMHFVVGLEPVDLEQIKDRYYTPNLLQRIFKGEDLSATRKVSVFTAQEMYPVADYAPLKDGETVLKVKLRNRGGGIGAVQVFVNGTEFLADARPKGFNPNSPSLDLSVDFSSAKTLRKGEPNDIRIVARNGAGWLRDRGSSVVYLDKSDKDESPPEFYAIVGGVADYENAAFNLRYSAKDARDFARALELGATKLFGRDRVHIRLLASGPEAENKVLAGADSKHLAPGKENFRKAFEEFRKAKPNDVFVVYLAGHGTSINRGGDTGDTYLYLTKEAVTTEKLRLLDEKLRSDTTISSEELAEWIRDVPALKRAMILDTCAAGAVETSLTKPRDLSPDQIKALDRMKDRTGFYVLMGSAADAQSYEASRYGQGLLTYSLLQALSGAKLRDGEYADVSTLFGYAEDTVVEMAKGLGGIQQPRIIAPTESRSFDIGQFSKDEKSKFTLAKIKPLVLQPVFLNDRLKRDNLKLSQMVAKALREESSPLPRDTGTPEARIVYVEAEEMTDAVTPTGVYEVTGETVKVTLILVRNDKEIKTIPIEGAAANLGELSQRIVKTIAENSRE